jgi:hypothetical protein
MPCHHNLEEYLTANLDGAALRDDPKGPLFRTIGIDPRVPLEFRSAACHSLADLLDKSSALDISLGGKHPLSYHLTTRTDLVPPPIPG